MIADEAIRLVEFIRENDEDRYESKNIIIISHSEIKKEVHRG